MVLAKIRPMLDVVTTAMILVTCAVILYVNWPRVFPSSGTPDLPTAPIFLEGATLVGSPTARVVIVEYSDYMCPYCGKVEKEALPDIHKQYIQTGQVQLAFRHHPLEQLHPGATKASEAALCAGRQGKFWEMHAALFRDQRNMNESSLIARARDVALDEKAFKSCLSGETVDQVQKDVASAEALRLSGTPVFLIGRRQTDGAVKVVDVLWGSRPAADFAVALAGALSSDPGPSSYESYQWYAIGGGVLLVGLVVARRRGRQELAA